ncbi:hypothetical protein ACTQ29_06195 [Bifidobacterium boum]|uniref:hypothetical protein n=1 Tax=Bifidobacterium boum TaxID=78343 RepID=UPI003F90388E
MENVAAVRMALHLAYLRLCVRQLVAEPGSLRGSRRFVRSAVTRRSLHRGLLGKVDSLEHLISETRGFIPLLDSRIDPIRRESVPEIVEGVTLDEMIDIRSMVPTPLIHRHLHRAALKRVSENPIRVIMPMPTIDNTPRGLTRTHIPEQMHTRFHIADPPMLGHLAPHRGRHVLDLPQTLLAIMPHGMGREHDRPVMLLAMLEHGPHLVAPHNLDFMVADRANPHTAASLKIAVTCAHVGIPPQADIIRPAQDTATRRRPRSPQHTTHRAPLLPPIRLKLGSRVESRQITPTVRVRGNIACDAIKGGFAATLFPVQVIGYQGADMRSGRGETCKQFVGARLAGV